MGKPRTWVTAHQEDEKLVYIATTDDDEAGLLTVFKVPYVSSKSTQVGGTPDIEALAKIIASELSD